MPRVLIIAGLIGGSFVATGNFILYAWILPEVTGTLQANEKTTTFMVNFRLLETLQRHAELAPGSKRRTAMYILLGVGFLCMFTGAFFILPWSRPGGAPLPR
jgi:ABC-type amino acid transport system permease subunit